MVLNPESKYPYRRAYVVNLRGDAEPGALAGRIENMVTGRQHEFASARELLASIETDLGSAGGQRAAESASDAAQINEQGLGTST